MQFSHSRVETFMQCPYKYKMRYVDRLKTIAPTNADNPLLLGKAIHTGIEEGTDAGIKAYYDSFPIAEDAHITEAMKLEYWIPKVRELLPEGGRFEEVIQDSDFIGYMDYLVPTGAPFEFDLYDFKYSNNVKNYIKSGQLHEYKYFFEKTRLGQTIRNMYFVFIPKVNIKQKKTEDIMTFRRRVQEELTKPEIQVVEIGFNYVKVVEFGMQIKTILECESFEKDEGYLCNWCEYQDFCERGVDYMILPKNERRNIEQIEKKVVWLYGAPFSGKTFLANRFPDPLMLNTDGNIRFVDAPYISIKNDVKVEGRQTRTTLAWDVFKNAITELEKKDNDFKTIVVDLLEDCYEHCRIFMYDKLNISHESDDSFSAWDKVRTEFLSTMKRLMNMDYENIILISHEDRSKDITRKSGDKLTAIKPNIQDKIANKIAGMVDIVARVVADGDDRVLSFKTNEVIFGGGRLTVTDKEIPLDYDSFMEVYQEGNSAAAQAASGQRKPKDTKTETKADEAPKTTTRSRKRKTDEPKDEPKETPAEAPEGQETAPRRRRKASDEATTPEAEVQETETEKPEADSSAQKVQDDAPKAEESPAPRRRKRRGE
ncbi:MAG: AAA family ATPase [Anaerolineaceae bacterium]|nr:AAA family ATPase [Anaerolineaceae bacterium]